MSEAPEVQIVPASRLAELPVLDQLLADPHVRVVPRPIESRWKYEKLDHGSSTGFNPFRNEVYVGEHSVFQRWRSSPDGDLRLLNEGDLLVHEAMFVAHDYLHCWATATIQQLAPALGFGIAPIDADNVEAMAFALLLTEAAAVVGLDYWCLSTLDLDASLRIGTDFRNLAVTYREADLPEYQQFDPEFVVQDPGFFSSLAAFYCTGVLYGFDLSCIRRSPRLLAWLRHELSYGELQRRYTRRWLQHLSGRTLYPSESHLTAEVPVDEEWQAELIDELGARLWAKVKQGDPQPVAGAELTALWRSDDRGPLDFRFTNIVALPGELREHLRSRGYRKESQRQGMDQVLRRHRYPVGEGAESSRRAVRELRDRVDLETFLWSLGALETIEGRGEDHLRDLFFLG
jgi:hypothetical protein